MRPYAFLRRLVVGMLTFSLMFWNDSHCFVSLFLVLSQIIPSSVALIVSVLPKKG